MMLIIGFIVGSMFGFFIASLCEVSARSDGKDNHDF